MSYFGRPSLPRTLIRLATTAIVGTSLALSGAASAHAAVACQSTGLSTAAAAGSCFRPFTSASPFNIELGNNPGLAADNSAVQQHMASYGWTVGASSTGFSIGASDGTRPIYYASPSDPVMTIHCTSSEGAGTCQGANGVNINGAQINVPAGAKPEANGDAHMTIIETATGQEYDLWQASVSGSTITSGTGAVSNVNSGNGTGGGGDAANFALSAGLLRPSELASGQINHALVVVVPCTNATGAYVGYTWPANGGWGQYCGQFWNEQASNAPELGQLIKLNMSASQIAASGAPAWQQTIMTALANYGAYIEDTEGGWHNEGIYILTQSSTSWTSLGQSDQWASAVSQLGGSGDNLSSNVPIPTSQLELVNTCATEGTCPNGTPTPATASPTPVAVATSVHKARHGRRGHSTRSRRSSGRSHKSRRHTRTHLKHVRKHGRHARKHGRKVSKHEHHARQHGRKVSKHEHHARRHARHSHKHGRHGRKHRRHVRG